MHDFAVDGYRLKVGSGLDRALLVKFMQRTYQEVNLGGSFLHLARTVDQLFTRETPLWWVEPTPERIKELGDPPRSPSPVACLWLGNVVDQMQGDRHAHIFLLYVEPEHRRRGIGLGLVSHAVKWAEVRGDRQIGLQVFQSNEPAIHLYEKLGFQTQSLLMIKSFSN